MNESNVHGAPGLRHSQFSTDCRTSNTESYTDICIEDFVRSLTGKPRDSRD